MPLRTRSSPSGQASADYVALLAVVAVVLGAAGAALGSPPALASALSGAVRHGICLVAGGVCTPGEARAAGMSPCLVHDRRDAERLAAKAVLVRLERGDALLVERRSDGSAAVSFLDSGRGGVTAGVGLRLPWGSPGSIEGGAGLQFTSGRTWEFGSPAAAAGFVRRWSGEESLKGEARGLARRLCPFCKRHAPPPPPQATFLEGGAYGDFEADLGFKLPRLAAAPKLHEQAALGAVAGRRVGARRTTWYLRLDAATGARLGAVIGALATATSAKPALEVSVEGGRPVELRVRGAAALRGQLDLLGATTSLAELARRLRGASGAGRAGQGTGLGVEAQVALDLTDPRNRAAVAGVLSLRSPGESDDRLRELAHRLDADGSVDVGVYRVSATEHDAAIDGALGVKVGGSWSRESVARELLRAWSLRHGGALGEREDCVPA